jgi:putative PIN family toxin of toxin-antitoxin system
LRAIFDTNVVISGLFFGGWPYRVLDLWRDGRVDLVVSLAILEEYWAVARRLGEQYPGIDAGPFLELLSAHATVVETPRLAVPVCQDPSDDKFLACAVAGGVSTIVSGDRGLLRTSGYRGIRVLTPRRFVCDCLGQG